MNEHWTFRYKLMPYGLVGFFGLDHEIYDQWHFWLIFFGISLSLFIPVELVVTNLLNVLAWALWSWSYAYRMCVWAKHTQKHLLTRLFFSLLNFSFAVCSFLPSICRLLAMKLKLNSFQSVTNKIECVCIRACVCAFAMEMIYAR